MILLSLMTYILRDVSLGVSSRLCSESRDRIVVLASFRAASCFLCRFPLKVYDQEDYLLHRPVALRFHQGWFAAGPFHPLSSHSFYKKPR